MNTISYRDLKSKHLDNPLAKANAKEYFGDRQPSIYRTGFYSSPSWNWGYTIGIVGVEFKRGGGQKDVRWFEVVTQFGAVKSARTIYLEVLPEARS